MNRPGYSSQKTFTHSDQQYWNQNSVYSGESAANRTNDWKYSTGWQTPNYHRKHYTARRRRDIDMSPLLDVLKRIDDIDTSMEGRWKTRLKERAKSEDNLLRDSDVTSDNGQEIRQKYKAVSSHLSLPSYNEGSDSDNKNGDNKAIGPLNAARDKCIRAPVLRRHDTFTDLKNDIDTMDDISNFSSEEEIDGEFLNKAQHQVDGTHSHLNKSTNSSDTKDAEFNDNLEDNSDEDVFSDSTEDVFNDNDECDSSAGFNIDQVVKSNCYSRDTEWKKAAERNMESKENCKVIEDRFDKICEALDEANTDSDDSELSWRSRGYDNDFIVSRKSVSGSELIDCYNKVRSRHSSKSSNYSSRSGGNTPNKYGQDSGRTTPLAKPSRLFNSNRSAPVTRQSSKRNLISDVTIQGKINEQLGRSSDPVTRITSTSHFSERSDNHVNQSHKQNTMSYSQGIRENVHKAGGGVKVSELRAALEREIAKANAK